MGKHVDYYVSLNSPWTYLGSARFDAMVKKHGADVTIWPVDFGSVFAVSGGLPLPKRSPQRQAYRMMELKRWRDHLGVKTDARAQVLSRQRGAGREVRDRAARGGPHGRRHQGGARGADRPVGRGEEHRRSGDARKRSSTAAASTATPS